MQFCVLLTLLTTLCIAFAQEESQARLLVHKRLLNKYLVEGRDLVADYNIYNVGGSAAVNVQLKDNSFPEQDFELVVGFPSLRIDRLVANSNISHTVIYKAKRTGLYNFTAAEVTYYPSEDSKEIQVSYSTEPGEAVIILGKDFDRKFSPHMTDWAAFAVMTLPSLGIPFLLWYRSKSKI
uniref:Translocon-associated protein subunit beta n=1 Tax=Latrodectus hasselti TaxID=256736 RepID=A0A482ZE60_LATHA